jgi:hypothetical protein
VPLLEEI